MEKPLIKETLHLKFKKFWDYLKQLNHDQKVTCILGRNTEKVKSGKQDY